MIRHHFAGDPGSRPLKTLFGFRLDPSARLFCLVILAVSALFSQAAGFVTNKTTGKAQPGVKVTLMQLAETGATTALSTVTTDAQGHFAFGETLNGMYALESEYQDVKYTQVIPPMLPKDNLQVSVFNTTDSPAAHSVEQHIFFLEPGTSQMVVSETYILINKTQQTYRNTRQGSIRFYLPPEAKGIVQTAIIGPDQRPVAYTAQKLPQANLYQVRYPLPPGESRIDINYVIPYEGAAGTFRTVNPYENAKTRLVVAPGVRIEGEGLASLGVEPRTQAQIFGFSGKEMLVSLSGTGMIADAGGANGEGGDAAEGESPQIESRLPPIYDNLTLIVAAGGAALLFAFLLLYRKGSGTSAESPARGGTRAG